MNFPFAARPELKLAVQAALKAGKVIFSLYRKNISTTTKADGSPVTAADLKSHKAICSVLSSSQIPILSEEGERLPALSPSKWVVDPLDGTWGFVEKNGEFAVMIALAEKAHPVLGVIYQPIGKTLFLAEEGKGAYCYQKGKWERLSVSSQEALQGAHAVVSRHHFSEQDTRFLRFLNVQNVAHLGSCLKALAIAAGKADFYFSTGLNLSIWDTCASWSIVKEAGGKMTDLQGNELQYSGEELRHSLGVIASPALLHKKLVGAYADFLQKKA